MAERKKLIADEGYVYTDGTNFGKEVYLAEGDNGDAWHLISGEEYEKLINEGGEAE